MPISTIGTAGLGASAVTLTSQVTGTLPVANGGTARTTTLAECAAILTADSSTFSNGTTTKCSFTTATFDNKSGFASGGYTIPTAGVYTMTTTIRFRQASGGIANQFLLFWYKNGSELTRTELDGAAGSVSFYGMTITSAWNGSFALNDVITVYGYVSAGSGANTYYFVNNACTFNIRQLS
jgi:hypothetical protein